MDYEALVDSLEEDLKVVYTVPLPQVRRALDKWTAAIRKEVEALFSSGTLRRVTVEEAQRMEAEGLVTFAPAKCIFTLKPPQVAGQRVRRKCRLVICGNYVKGNTDFGDPLCGGIVDRCLETHVDHFSVDEVGGCYFGHNRSLLACKLACSPTKVRDLPSALDTRCQCGLTGGLDCRTTALRSTRVTKDLV